MTFGVKRTLVGIFLVIFVVCTGDYFLDSDIFGWSSRQASVISFVLLVLVLFFVVASPTELQRRMKGEQNRLATGPPTRREFVNHAFVTFVLLAIGTALLSFSDTHYAILGLSFAVAILIAYTVNYVRSRR